MQLPADNGPDADEIVSETAEEGLAVCGPGQGDALRLLSILADGDEVGLELIDNRPIKKRFH